MAHGRRNHLAWIGPLVGLVGLVSYFTLAVRVPALRDSAWLNLALVTIGFAIAVWGLVRRRRWTTWLGTVAALAFAGLLAGYVFKLSHMMPAADGAVAVGQRAPDLSLPAQDGRLVSLDELAGRRVVVLFYRGFW